MAMKHFSMRGDQLSCYSANMMSTLGDVHRGVMPKTRCVMAPDKQTPEMPRYDPSAWPLSAGSLGYVRPFTTFWQELQAPLAKVNRGLDAILTLDFKVAIAEALRVLRFAMQKCLDE